MISVKLSVSFAEFWWMILYLTVLRICDFALVQAALQLMKAMSDCFFQTAIIIASLYQMEVEKF